MNAMSYADACAEYERVASYWVRDHDTHYRKPNYAALVALPSGGYAVNRNPDDRTYPIIRGRQANAWSVKGGLTRHAEFLPRGPAKRLVSLVWQADPVPCEAQ